MTENYHTHTFRCGHASGTDEEYVQQAIAGGLQILGFSDHTPFWFPDNYCSSVRMLPEQLEEYITSVISLKEKYADKIQIRLGLEVEYYPQRIEKLLAMIDDLPVEYMILAQHWCGNEINEPYNGRPTEDVTQLARYCDQVIAGMDTGLFSYVAHPDLLNFQGDPDIYAVHTARLCQAAKDRCVPLEINLLGLREGRHYPRKAFWEIAGNVGCPVVFGCDAHRPQDLVDPVTEEKALALVSKYHLQLLEHIPLRSISK